MEGLSSPVVLQVIINQSIRFYFRQKRPSNEAVKTEVKTYIIFARALHVHLTK